MGYKDTIPLWEKSNLTLEEAAAYSGIGINKLRMLARLFSGLETSAY